MCLLPHSDIGVGSVFSRFLGTFNNKVWLSAAVQAPTAHVQGHFGFSSARPRTAAGTPRGDNHSVNERGNKGGKSQRTAAWLLFELFPGSQTRRWVSPNTGPKATEPIPSPTAFQDVIANADLSVNSGRGLVHKHRPQRCLLSHLSSPRPPSISPVRTKGQSLRVQRPSLWPVSIATHFYKVHGCSIEPAAPEGHQGAQLFGRLADMFAIKTASGAGHGSGSRPLTAIGPVAQLREEPADAITRNHLLRGNAELRCHVSRSLRPKSCCSSAMPFTVPGAEQCPGLPVPKASGPNGCRFPGGAPRPSTYEASAEMVSVQDASPSVGQEQICHSNTCVFNSSPMVEHVPESLQRCAARQNLPTRSSDHRRVPVGLGGSLEWCGSPGSLASTMEHSPHQCPRAENNISRSPPFLTGASEQACLDSDRQYVSNSLRQPPGRSEVSGVAQHSPGTPSLGRHSSLLGQGSSLARHSEFCSRSVVERQTTPERMETAPSHSVSDLGSFWEGTRRSFRLKGVHTLSTLVLLKPRRRTSRGGCSGTQMAQGPSVCLSSPFPDSSCVGEDQEREPECSIGGSTSPPGAMVCRSTDPPFRRAMANPAEAGSVVSSRGGIVAPDTICTQSVGLAVERDTLLSQGLSVAVTQTLQCARAPSTRALYSYRWNVFKTWCEQRHECPRSCPLTSVLEFFAGTV